ncbi:UNVERIFIED_CONTAM: hypothetical protein GTU68_064234 [Idotea baltica]|nr:hypothetical protein [Idotea baltica]
MSLVALGLSAVPALSGGGKVTSPEPGPPPLTEETTGQILETIGIAPAKKRSVEPVEYVAPPRRDAAEAEPKAEGEDEAEAGEAEVADAEPIDPRKVARKCSTCHGLDGIAKIPTAPNIAGSSRVYLETQLKAFRSGKRDDEIMTVIAKGLSDAELTAVAKWYSSIEVTTKIPD